MKKPLILVGLAIIILASAFLVPVGSYTTHNGICPTGDPRNERLDWVKGDRLQRVRDQDTMSTNPLVGCTYPIRYRLFVL